MRAPATVAVRVTVNRGAESMGEAQPRREQSRSGEGGGGGAAGREGEGRWPTLGGEPPSGWKRGREWVRVQGVEGVGRQLREPCGGLQFAASSWKDRS